MSTEGYRNKIGVVARPWQLTLLRFFARPWVEVTIAVLVLISVVLTLIEFTLMSAYGEAHYGELAYGLEYLNDGVTWIFVLELTLRFAASPSKWRFFREYWVDILAVLPLFRIFRAARVMRLLRLVRLLRLFGVVSRLSLRFPAILRRGLVEYFFVCCLLVLTVFFGTGAMMYFEGQYYRQRAADPPAAAVLDENDDELAYSFHNAFWFSVYSLFAGEPTPAPPKTLGGRVISVFVMFMGLTIFAMFTGTVSAFMVERLQTEGHSVDPELLHDHIVICGWNSKAEIIAREYQASHLDADAPIIVVAQIEHEQPVLEGGLEHRVMFLNDDFTRIAALERAGIHRASTCIILADQSGGRSEQDADARTILAALTVEKMNPAVYTCAELLNRSYGSHLSIGKVNDYVVSGEYSAYLLAQAAMNRGLMGVFNELLTYQRGNGFYRVPLPAAWQGRPFVDLFVLLKREHNMVLVGVQPAGESVRVNPLDHEFQKGDELVIISENEPQLNRLG